MPALIALGSNGTIRIPDEGDLCKKTVKSFNACLALTSNESAVI